MEKMIGQQIDNQILYITDSIQFNHPATSTVCVSPSYSDSMSEGQIDISSCLIMETTGGSVERDAGASTTKKCECEDGVTRDTDTDLFISVMVSICHCRYHVYVRALRMIIPEDNHPHLQHPPQSQPTTPTQSTPELANLPHLQYPPQRQIRTSVQSALDALHPDYGSQMMDLLH